MGTIAGVFLEMWVRLLVCFFENGVLTLGPKLGAHIGAKAPGGGRRASGSDVAVPQS